MPVQPVRGGGARGAVGVAVVLLAVVGLLAWQPWSGAAAPTSTPERTTSGPSSVAEGVSIATPTDAAPPPSNLLAVPTIGPWSGRIAFEWSIVAFLQPDRSRDPLNLRQEPVAVFIGAVRVPAGGPDAICDAAGTSSRPAAVVLPTREVRYLGIAYPADRTVYVDRVVRVGAGVSLGALPVELGRIPGTGADVASPPAGPSGGSGVDPVQMFRLPGGGPWPDGVYRFDVFTRDGPPAQLYACIRP
jgi:hypothetical protein